MVTAHLRSVDDLNDRARHLLQHEGRLGPDMVRIGRRAFTSGDEVLALRNDYRLGLLNGTRGTIHRIDARAEQVEVLTDGSSRLSIPFDYAAAGHLTHGYAATIHKAQGATVDRCFILSRRPPLASTPTRRSPVADMARTSTSLLPKVTATSTTRPRLNPINSIDSASRLAGRSGRVCPPTGFAFNRAWRRRRPTSTAASPGKRAHPYRSSNLARLPAPGRWSPWTPISGGGDGSAALAKPADMGGCPTPPRDPVSSRADLLGQRGVLRSTCSQPRAPPTGTSGTRRPESTAHVMGRPSRCTS